MTPPASGDPPSSVESQRRRVPFSGAADRLYGAAAAARRRWYERHPEARRHLERPVISVGNLSVGGTGKTPLTMALAEWLLARGERPAILSRGYKRADPVDGVVVVSDGQRVLADLSRAGDEPLMIARAVPRAIVCVAEDRHLAGVVAERRLDATVHILDDGFQHVRLARDFDILLTSPGEITSGRTLPTGRLRESPAAAARAHFVVVVDAPPDAARTEAWELGISGFAAARRRLGAPSAPTAPDAPDAPIAPIAPDAPDAPIAPIAPIAPDAPSLAVAGIGQPAQFFRMLHEGGYRIETTMAFPDHHRYSAADVARIVTAARSVGAQMVLTTEKDAVRFGALGEWPVPLVPVRLHLDIDGWDALTASLDAALRRARERT